mgnify:CR=1 FL=1
MTKTKAEMTNEKMMVFVEGRIKGISTVKKQLIKTQKTASETEALSQNEVEILEGLIQNLSVNEEVNKEFLKTL